MPKHITLKKHQIDEIIDDTDSIIGTDDSPTGGSNLETYSGHKTTDQNAQSSHQNYRNDFVGRFGWGFYEGEEKSDDKVIQEKEEEPDKIIDEAVVEDIVDKSTDKSVMDKTEKQELLDKKLQSVADKLSKLKKDELNKLINLVEIKIKNKE